MNFISTYIHIKNNSITVNGNAVLQLPVEFSVAEFLSEAYKSLGIGYPKYHKMDALCKLGVLASEYLVKQSDVLNRVELNQIGIVLSNAASSLETDRQHQQSIDDKANYFPSPAVFVYTLPNIVIGEIAIKHHITGENAFFVSEQFDESLLVNYAEMLLNATAEAVIGGWVNVDGASYDAFIFLAEKEKYLNKNTIFKPLNQITVNQLYHN